MRDGLPFSARVISDGTLRVLALLTLLHDPKRRGLICFEEPENGVHPARVKRLVQRLRNMVTRLSDYESTDGEQPLSQLLLNSHSPVVLSALLDQNLNPEEGEVLFADTTSLTDPIRKEVRRKTRLRAIQSAMQQELFDKDTQPPFVSSFEVKNILETVSAEG